MENSQSWPDKIVGETVWDGKTLENQPEKWLYQLTQEDILELDTAIKYCTSLNKPLIEIDTTMFPLPQFSKVLAKLKDKMLNGIGFSLIRGFPILNYKREEQAMFFMGIGSYLGTRQPQNGKGHVLGHVKDLTYGSTTAEKYDSKVPTTRIYSTRKAQPFHVDGTDIVGLLCLQISLEGGISNLMSFHTLYNILQKTRPDILHLFKQPWFWDRKGEHTPDKLPYMQAPLITYRGGKVQANYSPNFLQTVERFVEVPKERHEAMKVVQEICEKEALNMKLEIGDIQFVHNHGILHARGAYLDNPEKTRHLLRLWLKVKEEDGGWPRGLDDQHSVYTYGHVPNTVPLEAE